MDPTFLVLAVFVLAVGLLALSSYGIRKLRTKQITNYSIDEHAANDLRVELLDYVKEESFGEGHIVDLAPFWRERRRLREADRWLIAGPLLGSKTLLILKQQRGDSFGDLIASSLDSWIDAVIFRLPTKVVLNPQVYQRMILDGVSSTTIINGNVDLREFKTDVRLGAGARAVTNVQGDSGQIRQDVHQGDTGISGKELENLAASLAAALRRDAETIDRQDAREAALELADDANRAGDAGDRNRILSVLQRARDGIRMFGSGMEETRKLVDEFGHLVHDL